MSIQVVCACGKKLQVRDELAGKRGKCPACGQAMTIPMPAPAAPAAADNDPLGGGGLGGLDLGSLDGLEGAADPLAANDPFAATLDGSAGSPLAGGPLDGGPLSGGPLGGGLPSGGALGAPGMALPGAAKPAAGKAAPATSETPWYLKWYVLAGAGAAALLLIVGIVVGAIFAFSGSGGTPVANSPPPTPPTNMQPGQAPPGEQTPSTPTPAPEQGPPKWKVTAADVTIEPGATIFVDVAIDRAGFNEAIQVAVEGLPDRVNTAAVEIPAGESAAKLVLIAAGDAAEGAAPIKLVATSGTAKVEQEVTLSVKKPLLPTVLPVAAVSLSPGQSTTVAVNLERNGHAGEILVQVEGLPDKVAVQPLTIPAAQSSGTLQIAAAPDAALAQIGARLVASVGGKTAESPLQLTVESFSVKIQPIPLPVVWVAPGASETVDVNLVRTTYKGPIELKMEGLPENVTAAPVTIPADQNAGKIVLTAAANAKDKVRSGKIVAAVGGASVSQLLIVRVKSGEGMLLPEVAVDEEMRGLLKRGSFGGRLTNESKTMLEDIFGGTQESEAAVMAGLRWLDRHQAADGHWSLEGYNFHGVNCNCKIAAEEKVGLNNNAGTALGVLPFLGAGITPTSAPESTRDFKKYQRAVKLALDYLIANQKTTSDDKNGDLSGNGNMYTHALCTLALCEAYALTKDNTYQVPAQKAVRYLLKAQHTNGGWGYSPKSDGDTSVVGWVFLAIRSGQLAGMPVEPAVFSQTHKYLDSTSAGPSESDRKARYSYKPRGDATLSLSAAGLLTRMYAGWLQDRPELVPGSEFLMQDLPPEGAKFAGRSYYYYYATNVLHHLEGKKWDYWNHRMREHLIRTQEQSGHAVGSWSPEGSDWGAVGGRIYSTSLSLLTLEVYYRHLPLYRNVPKSSN